MQESVIFNVFKQLSYFFYFYTSNLFYLFFDKHKVSGLCKMCAQFAQVCKENFVLGVRESNSICDDFYIHKNFPKSVCQLHFFTQLFSLLGEFYKI